MADKVVVDCSNGSIKTEALSSAEQSLLSSLGRAAARDQQARASAETQRQADLATLKTFATTSNTDPVWAAVARLLGAM